MTAAAALLRGVLVGAVVAATLTGCGSTVPGAASRAPSPYSSTNSGDEDQLSTRLPTGTPTGGSATESAAAGFADPSARMDTFAAPGAAGIAAPRARLGFFISDDASAVYKALGINGASHTRDESRAIWQAVIDEVNSRGGLGGRLIVPSYYFITSDSGTNASRSAAACAQFTEDEKVFAVVLDGASDLSMAACLARHHTPAIDVGQTSYPYDDADLRRLAPYLYVPGRLSMSRFASYVDTLAAGGFFSRGSKVGLLRFDLPDQLRTKQDVIVPALKRHGLGLVTDFAFTPVEGTGDLPRAANEADAAVLQMRAKGVDRVLFLGSGLSLPFVFPTVAESQGYRPRYGITTDDGPEFMATNAPAAQLSGAMAVGWEPQYDVAESDVVFSGNALWRQCVQVVRKAGFSARDGRRCTAIYFLEQSLHGAKQLSPRGLRDGASRLGSRNYSTQNYRTFFRSEQYDGVSAVRLLRFDAACTCFRYATRDVPV